jgi:hypothetical protein
MQEDKYMLLCASALCREIDSSDKEELISVRDKLQTFGVAKVAGEHTGTILAKLEKISTYSAEITSAYAEVAKLGLLLLPIFRAIEQHNAGEITEDELAAVLYAWEQKHG